MRLQVHSPNADPHKCHQPSRIIEEKHIGTYKWICRYRSTLGYTMGFRVEADASATLNYISTSFLYFCPKIYRHIVVTCRCAFIEERTIGFGKGLRLPWPLLVLLSWYLYFHMHVLSFPLCVCMCWHGWWAAITIACTGLNKDVLRIELSWIELKHLFEKPDVMLPKINRK